MQALSSSTLPFSTSTITNTAELISKLTELSPDQQDELIQRMSYRLKDFIGALSSILEVLDVLESFQTKKDFFRKFNGLIVLSIGGEIDRLNHCLRRLNDPELQGFLLEAIDYRIDTFADNYSEVQDILPSIHSLELKEFCLQAIGVEKLAAMITNGYQLIQCCNLLEKLRDYYSQPVSSSQDSLVKIATGLANHILQKKYYIQILEFQEKFLQVFDADRMASLFGCNIEFSDFLELLSESERIAFILKLGFERISNILHRYRKSTAAFFEGLKIHQQCLTVIYDILPLEQLTSFIQSVKPHWCDLVLIQKATMPTVNEMERLSILRNKPVLIKIGAEYYCYGNKMGEKKWGLTNLDSEICEKFVQKFSEQFDISIELPCDVSYSELYGHIHLKTGGTTRDRLHDLMRGFDGLHRCLATLTPDKRDALLHALGERITGFISTTLDLECLLSLPSEEVVIAVIKAMDHHLCSLIANVKELGDIYCRVDNWGAVEYIMKLFYAQLVKTDKEYQYLISRLKALSRIYVPVWNHKLRFLNELHKKTFSPPSGQIQRLQILKQESFELNDASSLSVNLQNLFTLHPLKEMLTPQKEVLIHQTALSLVNQYLNETIQPSPEIVQSLINCFQEELKKIDSTKSSSSSMWVQTPLEKSDVALRLQFAVGKLQKQLEELLSKEEDVSPSPAAKLS